MKIPMPNFSPKTENNSGKIEQERKPLAVYPIFRANDLYCSMFPEITPLFERGQEPSGQIVLEEIKKVAAIKLYQKIAMDKTCYDAFLNGGFLDQAGDAYDLISEEPIDKMIGSGYETKYEFSSELMSNFIKIATEKNPNIKKVFIIKEKIADHAGKEFSHNEDRVSEILKDKVKEVLGIDAVILESDIDPEWIDMEKAFSEKDETILIITDRHYDYGKSIPKNYPRQISVLPMETELYNNLEYLGGEQSGETFAKELRKSFEISS